MAVPPSLRPGLTRSTLHSATECAQQAGLDGSKSRAGRHLRKSDASLFRARSGSFEPAVAFAGRQGPQQDQTADRKSVVKGKRVSVRVDLGGRRIIKKTKHK